MSNATLPGADKMKGSEPVAEAKSGSGDLICYTGCQTTIVDEETGKPKRFVIAPGQKVTAKDVGGKKNLDNLRVMGRVVEADSDQGKYIAQKVKRLKNANAAGGQDREA